MGRGQLSTLGGREAVGGSCPNGRGGAVGCEEGWRSRSSRSSPHEDGRGPSQGRASPRVERWGAESCRIPTLRKSCRETTSVLTLRHSTHSGRTRSIVRSSTRPSRTSSKSDVTWISSTPSELSHSVKARACVWGWWSGSVGRASGGRRRGERGKRAARVGSAVGSVVGSRQQHREAQRALDRRMECGGRSVAVDGVVDEGWRWLRWECGEGCVGVWRLEGQVKCSAR